MASCHLELNEPEKGVEPVEHNMAVARQVGTHFTSVVALLILLYQVKEFFHQEGIHSTTIQLEYSPESGLCQFECPKKDTESQIQDIDCLESSCCRERPSPSTTTRGA